MMKHYLIAPILLAGVALSMNSCVSTKKYKAMQAEAGRLRDDSASFSRKIMSLNGSLSKSQMDQELTNSKLQRTNAELNMTSEQLAANQARLAELQRRIDQQRAATTALRKTISDALGNFNAEQLTVTMRNGKVYVSMSEKLLFPSGSAEVNAEGKTALAQLAKALNDNPDINIDVEGHTDTVPISKRFADNWALSVARSTEITRILIKDYGLNPTRIIASGRSQFLPVADNATPEGRARNRRTEIILEPKLDKIMELVDGAAAATNE